MVVFFLFFCPLFAKPIGYYENKLQNKIHIGVLMKIEPSATSAFAYPHSMHPVYHAMYSEFVAKSPPVV